MLEEFLEHVDDCRGSGWRNALLDTPGVNFLDQLGFDLGMSIFADLCFMPGKWDAVGRAA